MSKCGFSYHQVNKSDIFFTNSNGKESLTNCVKARGDTFSRVLNVENKDKMKVIPIKPTSKKNAASVTFVPKYKDETSFNRRIKEFFNAEHIDKGFLDKNKNSSKGAFLKENMVSKKTFDFGGNCLNGLGALTARETRWRDLNPELSIDRIKKLGEERNPRQSSRSEITINKYANDVNNNECNLNSNGNSEQPPIPKIVRVRSLQSNIFHQHIKLQHKVNKSIDLQSSIDHTHIGDIDNANTLFSRNSKQSFNLKKSLWTYEGAEEKDLSNKEYSPIKMKLNLLTSSLDAPTIKQHLDSTIDAKSHRDLNSSFNNEVIQIKQKLQQKFKHNEIKVRQNSEQLSFLHNSEFYKTALSISKVDRPNSIYEIDHIADINTFNTKEIKSSFANKGIHVYDINLIGKYNQTGRLTFKIRNNDDDPNFLNKLEEAKGTILNKGLNLSLKPTNHAKQKAKENEKTNEVENKKKLKPEEKYSNYKIEMNLLYKHSLNLPPKEYKPTPKKIIVNTKPKNKILKSSVSVLQFNPKK